MSSSTSRATSQVTNSETQQKDVLVKRRTRLRRMQVIALHQGAALGLGLGRDDGAGCQLVQQHRQHLSGVGGTAVRRSGRLILCPHRFVASAAGVLL